MVRCMDFATIRSRGKPFHSKPQTEAFHPAQHSFVICFFLFSCPLCISYFHRKALDISPKLESEPQVLSSSPGGDGSVGLPGRWHLLSLPWHLTTGPSVGTCREDGNLLGAWYLLQNDLPGAFHVGGRAPAWLQWVGHFPTAGVAGTSVAGFPANNLQLTEQRARQGVHNSTSTHVLCLAKALYVDMCRSVRPVVHILRPSNLVSKAAPPRQSIV